MQQTHAIKKQTVTVQAVSHDGFALKRKIERVLTDEVLPRLNLLFDRLAPADQWVQIERLDVALDNLHETESDEEIAEKIVEAIAEQIGHITPVSQTIFQPAGTVEEEPFVLRNAQERMLDAFVHFLRHGTLPWWFTPLPHEEFENRLNLFLAGDEAQPYRHSLQSLLAADTALRRLSTQFSDPVFWNMLALIFPHTQTEGGQARTYLAWVMAQVNGQTAEQIVQQWPATFKKRLYTAMLEQKSFSRWPEWVHPLPPTVKTQWTQKLQQISTHPKTQPLSGTPVHETAHTLREIPTETFAEEMPGQETILPNGPAISNKHTLPFSEETPVHETTQPALPTSQDERMAEAFFRFLQQGVFPDGFHAPTHAEWETFLKNRLSAGTPYAARYRSRLQQVLTSEKAVIRLSVQFSDALFWAVVYLLYPQTEKSVRTSAQALLTAITETTQKHTGHPVYRHLPAVLKKIWLQQAAYQSAPEILKDWESRLQEEIQASDQKQWVKTLQKHKLLKKYTASTVTDSDDDQTMDAFCQYLQRGTSILNTIELESRMLRILRAGKIIRYRNRLQKALRQKEAHTRLIHSFADETFWAIVAVLYPETDAPEIQRAQARYTGLVHLLGERALKSHIRMLPVALKQSWLLEKSPADVHQEWDTRLQELAQDPDWNHVLPTNDIAWPAPAEKPLSVPYFTEKEPLPEEGHLVANAGLVILGPFLPEFFKRCGVCEGDTLTQPEKALALLHYLAFGRTEYREYDILLNKVICGLEPSEPIDFLVTLDAIDRQHAEEMLNAVVSYWEALKGTSADGLREGFLQRTGKLTHSPEGWLLRPEQQTLDILLQYLPWTIGYLKLPWMPSMMRTEWN